MPKFSARSLDLLSTCHPHLQQIMKKVIEETDIAILCGHRSHASQDLCFANKTSTLAWPKSKHNHKPSLAVDVAPYPVDWDNVQAFRDLAVIIKRVAKELEIPVEWGGDWKNFRDYPHWQIAE